LRSLARGNPSADVVDPSSNGSDMHLLHVLQWKKTSYKSIFLEVSKLLLHLLHLLHVLQWEED
jgi:hypothetical protein